MEASTDQLQRTYKLINRVMLTIGDSESMGPPAHLWGLQPGSSGMFRHLLRTFPCTIAEAFQVCRPVSSPISTMRQGMCPCSFDSSNGNLHTALGRSTYTLLYFGYRSALVVTSSKRFVRQLSEFTC